MEKNYEFLNHACIRFDFDGVVCYTDPYNLIGGKNDADIIFITHGHFDHYSISDIFKVGKDSTIFVIPEGVDTPELDEDSIVRVKPNNSYDVKGIKIETIPAYNINKQFHKKEEGWVGYILEHNGVKYYVAGDTDITAESRKVKCDVAFVPVGGTYTMTSEEAAQLVNEIKPQIAVPIHYGKVVGSRNDAKKFQSLLDENIECNFI
ncbi:MAG: MBL fold metallo-hydrolase [Clostridia bacterium]|nr:MBL fold metallo-hydrolase [Clostridia bacterium]